MQLSFLRNLVEYSDLSPDLTGKIQLAYAKWLLKLHPETPPEHRVFTKTVRPSYFSYPGDLTPDQQALLEENKKAIEKIDYSELEQLKYEHTLRLIEKDFSQNRDQDPKKAIRPLISILV